MRKWNQPSEMAKYIHVLREYAAHNDNRFRKQTAWELMQSFDLEFKNKEGMLVAIKTNLRNGGLDVRNMTQHAKPALYEIVNAEANDLASIKDLTGKVVRRIRSLLKQLINLHQMFKKLELTEIEFMRGQLLMTGRHLEEQITFILNGPLKKYKIQLPGQLITELEAMMPESKFKGTYQDTSDQVH